MLEFVSHAQQPCPFIETSLPAERICWCKQFVGHSTVDDWVATYVVSCITTTFTVRVYSAALLCPVPTQA